MTKNKKLTIIVAAALLVVAGIATIATTQPNKTPTPPIVPTVTQSSTAPSSEAASSDFEVPEIVPPEPIVISSAPESKKAELTVTGSPDGKVSSKPAEKPKPTESKPVSSVAPKPVEKPKPSKPTGDGDVYDAETGTYPKLGDTWSDPVTGTNLVWDANGGIPNGPGWASNGDGNKHEQPDVSAGNNKAFQDSYVCSKCGGSWDTCNCTLELAD